jgi:hypothetical protein
MSTRSFEESLARLNTLSETLFGEAADMDRREAEELLRTAGLDPEKLKTALYQRMLKKSEEYSRAQRPLPELLQQALEDLQPVSHQENPVARTARLAIARLLAEIRDLPQLLDRRMAPAFSAVYRNKKQLSPHDKKILDGVTADLRERIEGREPK